MAEITKQDEEFLDSYRAGDYERPSVTVDVLIFSAGMDGKLEVLLIKRKSPPYAGCWAIPGGFLNMEDKSLKMAAERELKEETHLTGIHMEQLYTFGDVGRDPRTRVISVAYIAAVPKGMLQAKADDDAADAEWFEVSLEDGVPKFKGKEEVDLAFDHAEIVALAIRRMQGKLPYTDLAFQFLKDKERFTIYELRKISEAVMGKKLDASNFRRSFLIACRRNGIARETGEVSSSNGHKASMHYKYNC